MGTVAILDFRTISRGEPEGDPVATFADTMKAMLEEHRPSRMPFFGRLAAMPRAAASDPALLGQIHLIYQSAMHATRAAVYYLPHLDNPALRKRSMALIGFSARAFDAVERNPDVIASRIIRSLEPGAIVLLHQGPRTPIRHEIPNRRSFA